MLKIMVDPERQKLNGEESLLKSPDGVRVTFPNPELLRAYSLDSGMLSTLSFAERISGIRERTLGDVSLDGQLFNSARMSLIIEPDRDVRGKRPTAILRTDLQLGPQESAISQFQSASFRKSTGQSERIEEEPLEMIRDVFSDDPLVNEAGIISAIYTKRILYIYQESLSRENLLTMPLVVLQLWDKDAGSGSISISLVSWGRYHQAWKANYEAVTTSAKEDGWEFDLADADRWRFNESVGIDTYDPKAFNQSLAFYEKVFPQLIKTLYQTEGLTAPSLSWAVESPLVFTDKERVTFADIGGQEKAVSYLQALVASAKLGNRVEPVLFVGPPGFGKSSLAESFATEAGAPFIKKTSNDLLGSATEESIKGLIRAGYLEAKAAAIRGNGKAVFCLENMEFILGANGRLHDFLINEMDAWISDEVIFVATSNSPEQLHPGIIDRSTIVSVLPPGKEGMKEILQVHVAKVAKIAGQDIFSAVDLSRVAENLRARGVSGRRTRKLLSEVYLLSRQHGQIIDTDFFLGILDMLIPERRLGFGKA